MIKKIQIVITFKTTSIHNSYLEYQKQPTYQQIRIGHSCRDFGSIFYDDQCRVDC